MVTEQTHSPNWRLPFSSLHFLPFSYNFFDFLCISSIHSTLNVFVFPFSFVISLQYFEFLINLLFLFSLIFFSLFTCFLLSSLPFLSFPSISSTSFYLFTSVIQLPFLYTSFSCFYFLYSSLTVFPSSFICQSLSLLPHPLFLLFLFSLLFYSLLFPFPVPFQIICYRLSFSLPLLPQGTHTQYSYATKTPLQPHSFTLPHSPSPVSVSSSYAPHSSSPSSPHTHEDHSTFVCFLDYIKTKKLKMHQREKGV